MKAMADAAQRELRQKFPTVYHVAKVRALEKAEVYYPETYAEDGFTHATAEPSKLLEVLNHFYKSEAGDYVCLGVSVAKLEERGIPTVFEGAKAVGATAAFDGDANDLFPHIFGGIPRDTVTATYDVRRHPDGSFLEIVM
mmetsp:Transcript_32503/g.103642  ORF Transcript_32503/g.103642 Transcript_32503/m.103642 type:complete len:140 (+) Transcript_32503:29-448(+)